MYMYVCTKPNYRTWTYQPEKMSHTSLCVRVIHHFASWVQWDKPGSSLFYLINPLWERGEAVRGQQPQLLHVDTPGWMMLNINHPLVRATQITPLITVITTLNNGISDNTLTPAMSLHTPPQLELHYLVKSANTLIQTAVCSAMCHSQAFHLWTSLIPSHLRRCRSCSLTRFTRKLFINTRDHKPRCECLLTNQLVLFFPHFSFLCHFQCMQENCFELHRHKQELQSSSLSLVSLPDCL